MKSTAEDAAFVLARTDATRTPRETFVWCGFMPQLGRKPCATILLIDDDPHVLPFIKRCLEMNGDHRGLAADSADQARAMCGVYGHIDLIISDVNLVHEYGPIVARELAGQFDGVPVLFISGLPATELIDSGLLDRRDAFLQKPFRPQLLVGIVNALLE